MSKKSGEKASFYFLPSFPPQKQVGSGPRVTRVQMRQWLIVPIQGRRAIFVLAMVMVIACPILAVLPEESRSSVRSLSDLGIVISSPAAGASMNSTVPSLDKSSQEPIIAAAGTGGSPQKFTTRADQGWSIRWNPITDTPHLITGRALTLQGAKTLTKEIIEPACLDFVAANANLLKVHPGQLRLANKIKAGGGGLLPSDRLMKACPFWVAS